MNVNTGVITVNLKLQPNVLFIDRIPYCLASTVYYNINIPLCIIFYAPDFVYTLTLIDDLCINIIQGDEMCLTLSIYLF